jgi:sodium transport system ATP-binding protein
MTIHVRNLSKTYRDLRRGEVLAVDNLSFEVRPGEIFALLGPNGAGKTTAMRILCTVLKPSGGKATVAGFDVLTQPQEVRRNIGFLSANTGVYDRMSAWEFVQYFGRLYGMPDDVLNERMHRVFTTLHMNDFKDVLGAKMSTGMKQKVSIARAIIHDPPVLVFDEPTSGLDVLVARNVMESILALRDQGKCILYSTHIMTEVEKLCTRLAIMYKGKVLASGGLKYIMDKYGQTDVEELFFSLVRAVEPLSDGESRA